MANVFDVAKYIIDKTGQIETIKLNIIAYYCQAWYLVWFDKPLFPEEIQAWASGPAVPALFDKHGEIDDIDQSFDIGGDINNLTDIEKEIIDFVLNLYGDERTWYLVDITQLEPPWITARGDTEPGHICSNIIPHMSMYEYYISLL